MKTNRGYIGIYNGGAHKSDVGRVGFLLTQEVFTKTECGNWVCLTRANEEPRKELELGNASGRTWMRVSVPEEVNLTIEFPQSWAGHKRRQWVEDNEGLWALTGAVKVSLTTERL